MTLSLIINFQKSVDLFAFYKINSAVNCPSTLWFECFMSSLKMKHSVLIIESESISDPKWNESRRWEVGDGWCWISPRALNPILDAYREHNFSTYEQLKSYLSICK